MTGMKPCEDSVRIGSEGAAVTGERAAELVAAFRDNRHAMYRVARRVCGDDCAADVVQDAFLRVWRSSAFDATRGTLRSYLMTVTHGIAVDAVRHSVAMQRRDLDCASFDGALDGTDEDLLREHDRERVRAALMLLNDAERAVIVASFFRGLTHREIADGLALPDGTVKSRIRVAMTKLRYHLRETDPLVQQRRAA